jgi:hypothetical protein
MKTISIKVILSKAYHIAIQKNDHDSMLTIVDLMKENNVFQLNERDS